VASYRVKYAVALAVLFCAGGVAAAQDAAQRAAHGSPRQPPPIVVPRELSPPQEAYAAFPDASAAAPEAASQAMPSACQLQLSKLATFRPLPTLVGPGECGATDAVLLDAVILPDQNKVTVSPAATLRCPMAEQIAQWVRDDVAPGVLRFGAPLRGLDNFDSYECRGRNRIRGAVLSEHGRADALDVRLFKLADGQTLTHTRSTFISTSPSGATTTKFANGTSACRRCRSHKRRRMTRRRRLTIRRRSRMRRVRKTTNRR
jgi:hypothetical protein